MTLHGIPGSEDQDLLDILAEHGQADTAARLKRFAPTLAGLRQIGYFDGLLDNLIGLRDRSVAATAEASENALDALDVARSGLVVITGTNTSTTANRLLGTLLASSLESAVTVSICSYGTRVVAVRWGLTGIDVLVARTHGGKAGCLRLLWEWPCERARFAGRPADRVYTIRNEWLTAARAAGDQVAWAVGAGQNSAGDRRVRLIASGFPPVNAG